MNINWKIRLKNKTFVTTMTILIIAFVYQMLAVFGVVPKITQDAITEICSMIINLFVMLGVVVDPTTQGIEDSERAMTYGTEGDVRNDE